MIPFRADGAAVEEAEPGFRLEEEMPGAAVLKNTG